MLTRFATNAGGNISHKLRGWTRHLAASFLIVLLVNASQSGCSFEADSGNREAGPGGRPQPLALSPSQELAVGRRSYAEVVDEVRDRVLPDDDVQVKRVRGIVDRVARAAAIEPLQREILLRVKGYRFDWQVSVVRDRQVNAFCLPAGKMVVFTGILPVAANDDQLASVLSHEMAHALAHHASERVAREQTASNILRSLSYDRLQESEADHIGLFLMTFAGYDPTQAVGFWERMQAATRAGGRPPEFLSDHPSDEHRIRDLRAWIPTAQAAMKAFDEGRVAPVGR
jgi:metalloendopeptidase OMA1, mitochondrial